MTSLKKAPKEPDEVISLDEHIASLASKKVAAEVEGQEGEDMLAIVSAPTFVIDSQAKFEETSALVGEMKSKRKFLDEERKVSVTPLNDEVDRINAWYKPALTAFKSIIERAEQKMAAFVIKQKAEEARLRALAEAAAQRALAAAKTTDADVQSVKAVATQAASAHVAAASAAAPTAANTSIKPRWKWVVKDPLALAKAAPQLTMPDSKAINAWVALNGNKNVPDGLEVEPDIGFTHRAGK